MEKNICEPHGTGKLHNVVNLSQNVKTAMKNIDELNTEERFQLVMELLNRSQFDRDMLLAIKNHSQNKMKKMAKEELRNVEMGASGLQCTVDSSAPITKTAPVFTSVNFIYRGDLLPTCQEVFLDVEKIIKNNTHKLAPSSIAVVDKNLNLILWALVKQDDVCRYNAQLTGINKAKMDNGISYENVKPLLEECLKGRQCFGFKIKDDLRDCGIQYDRVSDLHQFFYDKKNNPISVEDLGKHFLGKNMQVNSNGSPRHCSIRDARVTVLCHKKLTAFLQRNPNATRFECKDLDGYRESKSSRKQSEITTKWDSCSVGCSLREKTVAGKKKKKMCRNMFGGFQQINFDDFEFGGSSNVVEFDETVWQ